MTNNRWIENSRSFFALLLKLYPRDHRDNYAVSMLQVFTDQCRTAYQEKGFSGILFLWLRTLPDLGYTAVVEHFASPQAAWGLMEPVPNAPLPWRGVFLILLPAMVYLVSQISQIIGEPWYLTVYYRAAFFLIIPPALVWVITRRFPIWGLIPLGLLFRLLQEIGYQLIVLHPNAFSGNPLLNVLLQVAKRIQTDPILLVILFVAGIVLLAIRYLRRQNLSSGALRNFWIWTGIYLLIALVQILLELRWMLPSTLESFPAINQQELLETMRSAIGWNLYAYSALLLLVFTGTLFTRRHGLFAILILVGYILPTQVIGIPWNIEDKPNLILGISAGVLAFRSLLSLITPIWMSRTPSQAGKKRVVIYAVGLALIIHAAMQFIPGVFYQVGRFMDAGLVLAVLLLDFKWLSAILLGMVLYQEINPPVDSPARQSCDVVPELKTEKA